MKKIGVDQSDWAPRINLLVFFIIIFMMVIVWRLFQKSVIEHQKYAQAAENQYEISTELPSKRGTIYAQDQELGKLIPVAATAERFDISVVPKNVQDKPKTAQTLAQVLGLDEKEILVKIDNEKLYIPPLARGITKEKKEEVVKNGFIGLILEKHHKRVYPENQTAAHVIGFVNRDNNGSYGIEEKYNEELKGKAGSITGEKDTLGRVISTIEQVNPKNGVNIELTIDHNLQFAVEQLLKKRIEEVKAVSGQVVIVNPDNGAILALAVFPDFDPNKFNEYKAEEHQLFLNPTISNVYEPGSIMKPIVMAMAIDRGKVEPDSKQTFGRSVIVGGYEINNALDKGYGESTMTQVLEHSDNVGMVWISTQMTSSEMHESFSKFGFGYKTQIDLPGEITGSLLPVKDWRDIHQANMAFGQGISATLIQMIRAWAVVVNGGNLVTPHVVERLIGERGVVVESDYPIKSGIISPESSEKLKKMLLSTVDNGPYGRTRIPGYKIGGKTGTAQIANPEGGYLDNAFTHSLVTFFPADQPKFLTIIKIDRPQEGNFAESTAGPLFKEIANYMINYYKIPPDQ